jgi:putative DNA primase/helicase
MPAARDTVTDLRLKLRAAGFSPTPVNGKAAVLNGWQNKHDVNNDEIKLWDNLFPHASGTGILTQHTPVFDIDISNEEAAEAVEHLARERFEEAGRVLVRVGRPPKRAIPFRSDAAFKKISISLIAANGDTSQKLELLAAGQQLVAFGIHPETQLPYQWHGGEPGEIKREELPEIDEATARQLLEDAAELLIREFGYQRLPARPHKGNGANSADTGDSAGAADWAHLAENVRGGRDLHDSLRDLAAKLITSGMGAGAAVNFLRGLMDATTAEHDKRWLERRLSIPRLVESAEAKLASPSEETATDTAPAFSEEALAIAFATRHANDLRYVAKWGKWLRWDGKCWAFDETREAFNLARQICREMAARRNKSAKGIASAKTRAAVLSLASDDRRLAATHEQWDIDPWLLNTPGGVVDLRTGNMRPAVPEDYMTMITATAPGGACPLWRGFLKTVTGSDAALERFLQAACGYSLTGLTIEEMLLFLHGLGQNGKSVFIRAVAGVLGDYHTVAPVETFLDTQNERHPTELAGLRGARMVTAAETEEGRRWAESKIKTLTGGDRISARFMKQDFFEFTPQFTLWIYGNHKPGLKSVDTAIRRRIRLVPFTVTIPDAERDNDLSEKLKQEWPGILAWAIEGCAIWQREGLAPPQAVADATSQYLAAEDAIGRWLDECCVREPNAWTGSTDLFNSWKNWAEDNGEFVGSAKRLTQMLEGQAFIAMRRRDGRGFTGLRRK